MFKRILLPTDGSEEAEAAVDQALDIARTYDAEVHALFVVDLMLARSDELGNELVQQLQEQGEEAVDWIRQRADEEMVDCKAIVRQEVSPYQAILDYVEEAGIDLVVMGTQGRSGLERFFLGSTTELVVRRSPVPVIAVPSRDT